MLSCVVKCLGCSKLFSDDFACNDGHWGEDPEDYICPECLKKGLVDFYCFDCSRAQQYFKAFIDNYYEKWGAPDCSDCVEQMICLGPSLKEIEFKEN